MTKELLDKLIDVVLRVGFPTVLAAVLVWFVLVRLDAFLHEARSTQIEMYDTVKRCCAHRVPE